MSNVNVFSNYFPRAAFARVEEHYADLNSERKELECRQNWLLSKHNKFWCHLIVHFSTFQRKFWKS